MSKQPSQALLTWMFLSRLAGLVIVFSLLVAFMVSFAVDKPLDHVIVLAFLGIATGLLGIPAGYYLAKKNGGSSGN